MREWGKILMEQKWPPDERLLKSEVPPWIPSHFRHDRHQLDPFIRWYCLMRHRMPLQALWREMNRSGSPFDKAIRVQSKEIAKTCWELALNIQVALGLPVEAVKGMGEKLHDLIRQPPSEEVGEWHQLAEQVREFWIQTREE